MRPRPRVRPRPALTPREKATPRALRALLIKGYSGFKFLGWTKDGRRFVADVSHGEDLGGLGGRNLYQFRQVHDARNGAIVAAFRLMKIADHPPPGVALPEMLKTWRAARSRKAWAGYARKLHLAKPRAALKAPRGGWAVTVKGPTRGPGTTRLRYSSKGQTLLFTWLGFPKGQPATIGGVAIAKVQSPVLRLLASRSRGAPKKLLTYTIPFGFEDLLGGDVPPIVKGWVNAYWSPRGKRVVISVATDVRNVSEEAPQNDLWFGVAAIAP